MADFETPEARIHLNGTAAVRELPSTLVQYCWKILFVMQITLLFIIQMQFVLGSIKYLIIDRYRSVGPNLRGLKVSQYDSFRYFSLDHIKTNVYKNNITDMTDLKIKIVQGFGTIKKEKLSNIYEKSTENHIFIFQFKMIPLNNTFEVFFYE